jgi:hypothetical protein
MYDSVPKVLRLVSRNGGSMNREYDAFEVLPDGTMMWRATVVGREDAVEKLKRVAKNSPNEFRLMHIPTQTVIATINNKSA